METYENNENIWLNEIWSAYAPVMRSNDIVPYSKLSIYSSDSELCSWTISTLDLKEENEYYFRKVNIFYQKAPFALVKGAYLCYDTMATLKRGYHFGYIT